MIPANTITNDELAWLATGAGPMPASVSQRDTADVVKEMAAELLDRRRALVRDRRRAKQSQKLRWAVENLLVKVEKLIAAEEAGQVVDIPDPEPFEPKILHWPNRGPEHKPTIGDVLLEAVSAGALDVPEGEDAQQYVRGLFDLGCVRLDGLLASQHRLMFDPPTPRPAHIAIRTSGYGHYTHLHVVLG